MGLINKNDIEYANCQLVTQFFFTHKLMMHRLKCKENYLVKFRSQGNIANNCTDTQSILQMQFIKMLQTIQSLNKENQADNENNIKYVQWTCLSYDIFN